MLARIEGLRVPSFFEIFAVPEGKTRRRRTRYQHYDEAMAAGRAAQVAVTVHYNDGGPSVRRCPWTGKKAGRGWKPSHAVIL